VRQLALSNILVLFCARARNSFDISARREKPAFARQNSENRIRMLIQHAQRINDFWNQASAKRV
jgi:hypothetical protein